MTQINIFDFIFSQQIHTLNVAREKKFFPAVPAHRIFVFIPTPPDYCKYYKRRQRDWNAVETRALRQKTVNDNVRPVDFLISHIGVIRRHFVPEFAELFAAFTPVFQKINEAESAVE